MKRLAIAFAVLLVSPAQAATWITYLTDSNGSDGKHRTYQVDAASIAKHNGWVHANHRICLNYGRDCRTILGVSAQCKQNKLKGPGTGAYSLTRRNGDEWWWSYEISDGTRHKGYSGEALNEHKRVKRQMDARRTKLFNFLCG